jgi:predicted ester cyclase
VAWRSPRAGRLHPPACALYRRAFPDLHIGSDDLVIQDDCAASWILTGTHRGVIMNIPPTGRVVRLRGISMIHFENGLVTRAVRVWDLAGMLRTFGLLPDCTSPAVQRASA